MKIKQTKTVVLEGDFHEERISITGISKDLLMEMVSSHLNCCSDPSANELYHVLDTIKEGSTIEI